MGRVGKGRRDKPANFFTAMLVPFVLLMLGLIGLGSSLSHQARRTHAAPQAGRQPVEGMWVAVGRVQAIPDDQMRAVGRLDAGGMLYDRAADAGGGGGPVQRTLYRRLGPGKYQPVAPG